jgi:hypothetical protein
MFEMGHGAEMLSLLREHIREHPKVLLFRAGPAWIAAELGNREEAEAELHAFSRSGFDSVPRDMNWLGTMTFLSLACAELRDVEAAEHLLPLLSPFKERFAILGHATVSLGSVASHLARLEAILGNWQTAQQRFAEGRKRNEEAGAHPWLARSLVDEASERLRHGENKTAEKLLRRACTSANAMGMAHLLTRAESLSRSRRAEPRAARAASRKNP